MKRRRRNRLHKVAMRSAVKSVRKAVSAGDQAEARRLLPLAVAKVFRTASRGVIHQNAAARTVSRLTTAVNRMK